jgi:hypothetical protein
VNAPDIEIRLAEGLATFDLVGGDPGYPYELGHFRGSAVSPWILTAPDGRTIDTYFISTNEGEYTEMLQVIGKALVAVMIHAAKEAANVGE